MRVINLEIFNGFATFHEGFDGYLLGLSLEVRKADGTLGYSSNMYIPSEHAKILDCSRVRHGKSIVMYVAAVE